MFKNWEQINSGYQYRYGAPNGGLRYIAVYQDDFIDNVFYIYDSDEPSREKTIKNKTFEQVIAIAERKIIKKKKQILISQKQKVLQELQRLTTINQDLGSKNVQGLEI